MHSFQLFIEKKKNIYANKCSISFVCSAESLHTCGTANINQTNAHHFKGRPNAPLTFHFRLSIILNMSSVRTSSGVREGAATRK